MKLLLSILISLTSTFSLSQVSEVWQSHLPLTPPGTFAGIKIISDPFENLYIIYQAEDSVYGSGSINISKINKLNGSIEFRIVIDTSAGTEYLTDVITQDSFLYISGYRTFGKPPFLAKISSTGTIEWFNSFSNSVATDITVDQNKNIYTLVQNSGIEVWKFDPSGNLLNYFRNDTAIQDSGAVPKKIIINDNSEIFVAGDYYTNFQSIYSFFIKKFSQTGILKWENKYNSGTKDLFLDLSIDDSSNIYLAGTKNYLTPTKKYSILKYDSAGFLKWSIVYGSTAEISSIATDSINNLFAAGINKVSGQSTYDILKIDIHNSNYLVITSDSASIVKPKIYLHNQNLFLGASKKQFSSSANDFIIEKFTFSGNKEWTARYNDPLDGHDLLGDFHLMNNELYSFGTSVPIGLSVIKYNEITPVNMNVKNKIFFYPNPINSGDQLFFSRNIENLCLYSVQGKLLFQVNETNILRIPKEIVSGHYILKGRSEGQFLSSPVIILNK